MKGMRWIGCAVVAGVAAACAVAGPPETDGGTNVTIETTTSFGWTVHEEVENGLRQAGSSDSADEEASGFLFRQGRVSLRFSADGGKIEGLVRLRLEERTDILDFWGSYRPIPEGSISIGQMKIPSTGEVLSPDDKLDFIARSSFGRIVCDYSLLRTPYISPVMASKSYNRDIGIALKGGWPAQEPRLTGFAMVGNGLGAGRSVGGSESEEFLFTNSLGEYFYGARLEARACGGPLLGTTDLVLGAHGSRNRHENVALDSRGPVFDLCRDSWSADLGASFSWGQRIYVFYGSGAIDDDWGTAQYRYDYSGWGLSTFWGHSAFPLEIGVRYDELDSGYSQVDDETEERHWTAGCNWFPHPPVRLQLNYVWKRTVSGADPDLHDNILYLNAQFSFSVDAARL